MPFIDQLLKGIGQIMLQGNRWTGLLFLIGLFIGHWAFALAALVAAAAGTITARLFHFGQSELDAGLYGFSPALVGVALLVFFGSSPLVWALVVAGGALAAALQHLFILRKIPAYTFPFILVAWALIFLLRQYGQPEPAAWGPPLFGLPDEGWIAATANGFGQVIFQGGVVPGLLFFLGVLLAAPRAAVFAAAASIWAAVVGLFFTGSWDLAYLGLYGFNAVLTAIALAGPGRTARLWAVIGVVITLAIHLLLLSSGILDPVGGVLTFPFVAGTWITLLLQRALQGKPAPRVTPS
ncbi:MAG TPA: urea transporter [Flavobacteriales bacterium]|nr:urea transporter [Flavobacteriales bacterium]